MLRVLEDSINSDHSYVVADLDDETLAAAISGDVPPFLRGDDRMQPFFGKQIYLLSEASYLWQPKDWPESLSAWSDYQVFIDYVASLETEQLQENHTEAELEAVFRRLLSHEELYPGFAQQPVEFFAAKKQQQELLERHFLDRHDQLVKQISRFRRMLFVSLSEAGCQVVMAKQNALGPDVKANPWSQAWGAGGKVMKRNEFRRDQALGDLPDSQHIVAETVFASMTLAEDMSGVQTIAEYLAKEDNFDKGFFAAVGQILLALIDLHRQGLVHRDLKPRNIFILLQEAGLLAKLFDFEFACKEGEKVIGLSGRYTPFYYFPWLQPKELDDWQKVNNSKLDIFAVGISIMEIFYSASKKGDFRILFKEFSKGIESFADFEAKVPDFLKQESIGLPIVGRPFMMVIMQMLHPDQSCRPSAERILDILASLGQAVEDFRPQNWQQHVENAFAVGGTRAIRRVLMHMLEQEDRLMENID